MSLTSCKYSLLSSVRGASPILYLSHSLFFRTTKNTSDSACYHLTHHPKISRSQSYPNPDAEPGVMMCTRGSGTTCGALMLAGSNRSAEVPAVGCLPGT